MHRNFLTKREKWPKIYARIIFKKHCRFHFSAKPEFSVSAENFHFGTSLVSMTALTVLILGMLEYLKYFKYIRCFSDLRSAHFCFFLSPVGSGRTLRETVLESSPVLALLNQSFISSWSLVKELEDLQVRSLGF